jgi:hypothetical protein
VEYVLPLRWVEPDPSGLADLTGYLRQLSGLVAVTVVDGSPPAVFAAHAEAWDALGLTHRRPDPDLCFATGKVNGVWTALRAPGQSGW